MCVTSYGGGCLAGHGDDLFNPLTERHVVEFLADKELCGGMGSDQVGFLLGLAYGYGIIDRVS